MCKVLLLLLASGCVATSLAADMEALLPWSEDGALRLELSVQTNSTKDLNQIRLQLRITNTGTNVLVLDKELVTGFGLRFRTDVRNGIIFSEEKDVSTEEVKRLQKPGTNAVNERFVALKPGHALTRSYDLSKPILTAKDGHWTDRNRVHHGFFYEAMVTHRVPQSVEKLLIDAWYERGVWTFATPQFEGWYGKSPTEIGLWRGRAHSNTIIVERK